MPSPAPAVPYTAFVHLDAIGFATLLVLWLLYGTLSGRWSVLALAEGADGRLSSSKFQFVVWTIVILWSYAVVYAARLFYAHDVAAISDLSPGLLMLMGLSITTTVAAKGITTSYVSTGRIKKTMTKASRFSDLVNDDQGYPDLSKMQLMAWTLVAIGVYLVTLHVQLLHLVHWRQMGATVAELQQKHLLALPDIDGSLMVLMGLSQGGYIGKKLTTTTVPRLTRLTPVSGTPPLTVKIEGANFGDAAAAGLVTVNGVEAVADAWTDTAIEVTLPATDAAGNPWKAGRSIRIGLVAGGQDAGNTLPFLVG
ncbi:MAG: IPT/TIG domain-containing protein [Acidobacteriota bacterium]|nr:IPT/TIG domain-containing protein [Acidobacteriota bacterium]